MGAVIAVVGHDPVAADLTVAGEDGRPVFTAPATHVYLKHYRDGGVLYYELQGGEAWLAFLDLQGRPRPLTLAPASGGRWRVLGA